MRVISKSTQARSFVSGHKFVVTAASHLLRTVSTNPHQGASQFPIPLMFLLVRLPQAASRSARPWLHLWHVLTPKHPVRLSVCLYLDRIVFFFGEYCFLTAIANIFNYLAM